MAGMITVSAMAGVGTATIPTGIITDGVGTTITTGLLTTTITTTTTTTRFIMVTATASDHLWAIPILMAEGTDRITIPHLTPATMTTTTAILLSLHHQLHLTSVTMG